ncbi:MAG: membrane protein insertase YidC [Pseudomonadota bacterium]
MEKEDQKNFIIAMLLMFGLVFSYQLLFPAPPPAETSDETDVETTVTDIETGAAVETSAVTILESVEDAISVSDRIVFDGDAVDGSIRLSGAQIDDLKLKRHFATTAKEEELRLLRPEQQIAGYYASWYWHVRNDTGNGRIVSDSTPWEVVSGDRLTTTTPIKLQASRSGFVVDREISVDENYMFTYTDTITNNNSTSQILTAEGNVRRHGDYKTFLDLSEPGGGRQNAFAHTGLIGVLNNKLRLKKYKPLAEGKPAIKGNPTTDQGGWIGFTDKYWMTVLVPDQEIEFTANFTRDNIDDRDLLDIGTRSASKTIAPGESLTFTNRIFSGAKELAVLRDYQKDLSIPRFDEAVDWGWLWFLTKPFFSVMVWLKGMTGSFGLAIIAFVIGIKIILFPLYNKSYTSMAKMKKLAEPMKEIQERFKEDPQRRQQEILKLYRDEKANPLAGCLPILATIPIFFALYQTLVVTLEMRHAPFLYMADLSQPDPTAIGNLFGLIPFWTADAVKSIPLLGFVIGIGIMPVLYGVTTFITQSLSPPPPDPMQRRIMMALPIVFTFVFAGFAAGLVVYWVWNNFLSIIQQYIIMRRNGVETEIGKRVKKLLGKAEQTT